MIRDLIALAKDELVARRKMPDGLVAKRPASSTVPAKDNQNT